MARLVTLVAVVVIGVGVTRAADAAPSPATKRLGDMAVKAATEGRCAAAARLLEAVAAKDPSYADDVAADPAVQRCTAGDEPVTSGPPGMAATPARGRTPRASTASSFRLGIYGDVLVGGGVFYDGEASSSARTTSATLDLRPSFGLTLARRRGMHARLGLVWDLLLGDPGVGFGLEGLLDWDIGAGWRFGPRLAVSTGPGGGVSSGLRFENRYAKLGLDVATGFTRYEAGAVVTVGPTRWPGKLALLGVLSVVASVAVVALVGSAQGGLD